MRVLTILSLLFALMLNITGVSAQVLTLNYDDPLNVSARFGVTIGVNVEPGDAFTVLIDNTQLDIELQAGDGTIITPESVQTMALSRSADAPGTLVTGYVAEGTAPFTLTITPNDETIDFTVELRSGRPPTTLVAPVAVTDEADFTEEPTPEPTATPTPTATDEPTATPTLEPTATDEPSATPTLEPTATDEPSATPTLEPTATDEPTATLTLEPTATDEPSATPTLEPTATDEPSATPTLEPTATDEPSATPTLEPTATPTPTATATEMVTDEPTPEVTEVVTTDCRISVTQRINQRSGPGTEFDIAGMLPANSVIEVAGQTLGADGFVWWQLSDGTYVREDIVIESGDCENVPVVTP